MHAIIERGYRTAKLRFLRPGVARSKNAWIKIYIFQSDVKYA
jgi:hypothetical protein